MAALLSQGAVLFRAGLPVDPVILLTEHNQRIDKILLFILIHIHILYTSKKW